MFTGKGGVGKTSVAAATAVRAAARGRRTLITSTDPAHSLADVLDQPLGDGPTALDVPGSTGALFAQQIDAQARLERHWGDVRDYLVTLLSRGGVGTVQAEELVLLPGFDELFALIDLNDQVAGGRYDVVIVDCAPTAETLRLLTLPDALRWYVDHVVVPGRRVARAVRPLARGLAGDGAPIPADGVFASVERVHAELASVHALLQDATRASLRIVLNPERVAVAESQRTATSLALFGYAIDAVIVNRVLPDEVRDPYLAGWRRRHAEQLQEVERSFAPTPVLAAPLLDGEPIGTSALRRLGDAVYADRDETAALHSAPPLVLSHDGDEHVLRIALPFVTDDDVELHRRGAELHLKVAGVRRTVPLPATLRRHEVAGARLSDGWLELRFRPVDAAVVSP
jgi:arsenite/tail-anchored protein-transporting ATPase